MNEYRCKFCKKLLFKWDKIYKNFPEEGISYDSVEAKDIKIKFMQNPENPGGNLIGYKIECKCSKCNKINVIEIKKPLLDPVIF